ncbi:MAG TPA: STAS domain-containing protein [Gammaproteobacteria bacterium]|nr:STAS domain-containing protein [Gammaproteobacteria bacterium]
MENPPLQSELRLHINGDGHYRLPEALTFATTPQLYLQTGEMFDTPLPRLTFDLAGVQRVDSAGLALLLEWLREARRRSKEIRFENIPEQLAAIAKVSGLSDILTGVRSEE